MLKDNMYTNVMYLSGDLSFVTVPEINRQVRIFIKQNINPVFNLSKVTFSDNAGVALLVSCVRYAKSNGKKVLFVNLPKQLLDLIEAGGLREILPLETMS